MSNLENKNYFAHESAIIDEGSKIGKGTKIWAFSHVMQGSVIGKNCVIGAGSVVLKDVTDNKKVAGVPAKKIS